MKISFRPICCLALMTLLGGCGTFQGIHDTKVEASKATDEANSAINKASQTDEVEAPGIRVLTTQYISTDSIELAKGDDPRLLCDFPYNSGKTGRTLQEIGSDITAKCGMPVRITADAIAAMSGAYDRAISGQSSSTTGGTSATNGASSLSTTAGTVIAPPAGVMGGATTFALGSGGMAEYRNAKIQIVWDAAAKDGTSKDGTRLRPFLDALAARTGLSWKMPDGVITFYYLDTRTFQVSGMPADMSFGGEINSSSATTTGLSGDSSGSGGSSGQGNGGASTDTTKLSVSTGSNMMKDLQGVIASMLTPGVGRQASTFSTITVTDTPDHVQQIGDFITGQNKANSMQVRFNLRILYVQTSNSSESSLNLNALYSNLSKNYGVTIANTFGQNSAATTAGVNILNGNAHWSGSTAVADLLKKVGKVSTVYDQPLTILNYHPVSVKNIKSDMFVIGASTTAIGSSTSGIQSSVQQAIQTVGLNVKLLPSITPKGDEVFLQFFMDLSNASPITQQQVAGTTVQQTHNSLGSVTQSAKLASGQTLMLIGYRQEAATLNQTGTGDEHFQLLGGGQSGDRDGQYLVVLITPNVQS